MNLTSFIMTTIGNHCRNECLYFQVQHCIEAECPLWIIETTVANMVDFADEALGYKDDSQDL